jgi:hypothetical protein
MGAADTKLFTQCHHALARLSRDDFVQLLTQRGKLSCRSALAHLLGIAWTSGCLRPTCRPSCARTKRAVNASCDDGAARLKVLFDSGLDLLLESLFECCHAARLSSQTGRLNWGSERLPLEKPTDGIVHLSACALATATALLLTVLLVAVVER